MLPLFNIYPKRSNVIQFIYIWKLLYMFRVVPPPIIRSAYNSIHSIWYLSLRHCYLPLSWRSWNLLVCCAQHTQSSTLKHKMFCLFTTKCISLLYIHFSNVLEKLDNIDIGLQFRAYILPPLLKEDPTIAILILSGKIPN